MSSFLEKEEYMKEVQRMDTGQAVSDIQTLLNLNGSRLGVDGIFGKKTEAAVKRFQTRVGLPATGVVDVKTYAALTEDPKKSDGYESDGEVEPRVRFSDFGPSNYTWCLDNGHGGMIAGVYQTKGKRSPEVPPGVYEGEFNRDIVKRVMGLCQRAGIDAVDIVPEQSCVTLAERVRRANAVHRKKNNVLFISVHANAFGNTWNPAQGVSVFCQPGTTARLKESRRLAGMLQERLVARTGCVDRGVREGNLFVLRKTVMPAILSENGFMTNPEEARRLASDEFRDLAASAHFDFIQAVEKESSAKSSK
jgi:N-acetylmuramoyl-L-alanine amidase